jgi:glycine/D-amino acid oxidase-like deaminating enzyme
VTFDIAIGVDIGGTATKGGLVTRDGKVLARFEQDTPPNLSTTQVVHAITDLLSHLLAESRALGATPLGIGVSVCGYVDSSGRIPDYINLRSLDHFPIVDHLEDKFGLTVVIDNDMNCGVLGEYRHGAGKNIDRLMVMTVGTGIGMSVALGGRVLRFNARAVHFDDDPRRVEPRLAPSVQAVAVEADGAQVNPMQVAIELARNAHRLGATIATGIEAIRLRTDGDRVVGVDTATGPLTAAIVIIAAGPWSRVLAATAGVRLPVWPRKGHILVTESLRGWTAFNILEYGYVTTLRQGFGAATDEIPPGEPEVGTVLLPTPEGQMLLGSSRESAGWDHVVSRDRLRAIARAGLAILPSLAEVRVLRTYAGLRPWSPDGQPLLGPVEGSEGLWVATGHSEGITGAPIAGRLIADLIFGRMPHTDPNPFKPGRFDLMQGRARGCKYDDLV